MKDHDIDDRFNDLEEKIQQIFWLLEFWYGEVPIKYRKAFPKKGEYPYFKVTRGIKTFELGVERYPIFEELEQPKAEDYQKAKERMMAYSELAKLKTSEASSTSSEREDSPQEHISHESSPS